MTEQPAFAGIHHVKIPVSDLAVSAAWYQRALFGQVLPGTDHVDPSGRLFAQLIHLPGVPVPLELRLAPRAARAVAGYDPITLGAEDEQHLQQWAEHLDTVGVERSPVLRSFIGFLVAIADPDGLIIRIHTVPQHGTSLDGRHADFDSPWITTPVMRYH